MGLSSHFAPLRSFHRFPRINSFAFAFLLIKPASPKLLERDEPVATRVVPPEERAHDGEDHHRAVQVEELPEALGDGVPEARPRLLEEVVDRDEKARLVVGGRAGTVGGQVQTSGGGNVDDSGSLDMSTD